MDEHQLAELTATFAKALSEAPAAIQIKALQSVIDVLIHIRAERRTQLRTDLTKLDSDKGTFAHAFGHLVSLKRSE